MAVCYVLTCLLGHKQGHIRSLPAGRQNAVCITRLNMCCRSENYFWPQRLVSGPSHNKGPSLHPQTLCNLELEVIQNEYILLLSRFITSLIFPIRPHNCFWFALRNKNVSMHPKISINWHRNTTGTDSLEIKRVTFWVCRLHFLRCVFEQIVKELYQHILSPPCWSAPLYRIPPGTAHHTSCTAIQRKSVDPGTTSLASNLNARLENKRISQIVSSGFLKTARLEKQGEIEMIRSFSSTFSIHITSLDCSFVIYTLLELDRPLKKSIDQRRSISRMLVKFENASSVVVNISCPLSRSTTWLRWSSYSYCNHFCTGSGHSWSIRGGGPFSKLKNVTCSQSWCLYPFKKDRCFFSGSLCSASIIALRKVP